MGGGGESQPSGTRRLQGNRSHTSEVVPGQGAIFVASRPIFNKKSRWLRMHVHAEHLAAALFKVKVPLIHLGGFSSR